MFFGYLGPLLVDADGTSAAAPAPRQRTVLAVLLTRAGRPVPVDELAEFVWDGQPPHGAADTLRTYVMRLRRILGSAAGRIVTRDPGYCIEATDDEVDALRFARACREGAAAYQSGRWADARTALASGLALWRGDPLIDIPSQLLRDAEVPALHRQRLQAMHWRIEADLQLGGGEELVAELEALIAQEPLREQFHVLLMTALARAGRTSEALAVYRQARNLLVSQLGIEPGPELRELQRLILTGEQIGSRPTVRVSPPPQSQVPHQLPATAGHFAGRKGELKELDAILGAAGTVTISAIGGMAGIGKTTLALYWAHQGADRFPDGQLYVNLRGFGPAAPMPPGDALRGFVDALRDPRTPLPADQDAQEALYRSLTAGRRILIVLDNARDEQQVRPLLPGSPGCLTLITSRNQLAGLVATNGAIPISLDLLSETEAHELLSRRLGPERMAAEPAVVHQFVTSCTGLPLALCIAAARAALAPNLPLTNLSAQLSQPGLDALASSDPYADLRTVFSWSYERLSPEAARLFRSLPLFPGPDVSATAAASIDPAGRISDLLAELSSANLLEEYRPGRFRLHDLLGRYATECADQSDTRESRNEASRRVLAWYAAAAAAAARVLHPYRRSIPEVGQPKPALTRIATQPLALEWLETEQHNLVAAVELAAMLGINAVAAALPLALWSLFSSKSLRDIWLHTSLIGVEAARRMRDTDMEAHLCASIAVAYRVTSQAETGISYLRRALAIRQSDGDLYWEADVREYLSATYYTMGRMPEAIGECEQAVALARKSGNRRTECAALSNLGWYHQAMGRFEQALSYYLPAQAIATETGSPAAVMVQANLASLYLELHQFEKSITTATAALEFAEPGSMRVERANAHRILGDALDAIGRHAEASPHWRAALVIFQELGDPQADEVTAKLA